MTDSESQHLHKEDPNVQVKRVLPETKEITVDEEQRRITVPISSQDVDRENDRITEEGLNSIVRNIENQNRPLFLDHGLSTETGWQEYRTFDIIGKWTDAEIRDGVVYATAELLEGDERADKLLEYHSQEMPIGYSIGFRATEKEEIHSDGQLVGYEINDMDLLETSAVGIPANSDAMAHAVDIAKSLDKAKQNKDLDYDTLVKTFKDTVKDVMKTKDTNGESKTMANKDAKDGSDNEPEDSKSREDSFSLEDVKETVSEAVEESVKELEEELDEVKSDLEQVKEEGEEDTDVEDVEDEGSEEDVEQNSSDEDDAEEDVDDSQDEEDGDGKSVEKYSVEEFKEALSEIASKEDSDEDEEDEDEEYEDEDEDEDEDGDKDVADPKGKRMQTAEKDGDSEDEDEKSETELEEQYRNLGAGFRR